MVSGEPESEQEVADVLTRSQALGFLGDRPIDEVIEHARWFVRSLDAFVPAAPTSLSPRLSLLDLGSGGGVPGLVIAYDRPDIQVTLLDRRAKRTDYLRRAVSRLGWNVRVTVVCVDVANYQPPALFDVVVARGFGPPEVTLAAAVSLVGAGGIVIVSEPPDSDRWPQTLLADTGVERLTPPGEATVVFRRIAPVSSS